MYFVVYLNVNINRGLFMNETVNLTVYQFGPISEADVVFDKYTVLIGKQGIGKKYHCQIILHVYVVGEGAGTPYHQ